MKLEGRLTGHFLARVAMLLGGLGLVFMAWIAGLALTAWQANTTAVPPTNVLRSASRDTTVTPSGAVTLSAATSKAVADGGFWMQVLDERGDEVASTAGRPATVPRHYTPGGLVLDRQSPDRIGQRGVYTWVETLAGRELTFVLGRPGARPQGPFTLVSSSFDTPSQSTLYLLWVGLLVGGALVTLGVAWLFGRGLSRPLVHMMEWLSSLARGEFAEPVGRDGLPASRSADGTGRSRPYRTYREVFDALDTLTSELAVTAAERDRLETAREEWIAGVTHDLRTPLSSVRGYADVLASDYEFTPGEVRAQASVIAAQASHIDALIDDLDVTFRLRADALPLERRETDLIELAREVAIDLANDPRAAGREVVFVEPAGAGRVMAPLDAKWFRRALTNLLVNAAVHNPEGTTVTVSVERDPGGATVTVTDDGRGMDDATLGNLFDRYYRGGSTAQGVEGTGLGMAIARQIVEAHGGTVGVSSEVGRGTTVVVAIPLPSI